MAKGDQKQIIIIRKKKAAHGGHHGGAWKVAYADFVTAMMAFFMVMWILGMDQNLRNSVEGYFSNPVGYKKGYSAGRSPLSSGNSPGQVATTPMKLIYRRAQEEKDLGDTGGRIRARLRDAGLGAIGDRVEIVETTSGLRIELSEGASGQEFFATASASMTEKMRKTLEIITQELGPLRNPIIIEGHTDAARYSGLYSNWDLSVDRANAARRVMEESGLSASRIEEVRGLADRQLRNPDNPLDPSNRRISILLPFTTPPSDSSSAGAPPIGATGA